MNYNGINSDRLLLSPFTGGFFCRKIMLGGAIMPAVSKAQARLMQAAAHSRGFAKKVGIPMATAKEFMSKQKTPYSKLPARKK